MDLILETLRSNPGLVLLGLIIIVILSQFVREGLITPDVIKSTRREYKNKIRALTNEIRNYGKMRQKVRKCLKNNPPSSNTYLKCLSNEDNLTERIKMLRSDRQKVKKEQREKIREMKREMKSEKADTPPPVGSASQSGSLQLKEIAARLAKQYDASTVAWAL